MADELWHYGNLGAVVTALAWLLKKSFTAGALVARLDAMEEQHAEQHKENVRRLERIESLLMEKRSR